MWRYREKLEGRYQVVRLKKMRRQIFALEGAILLIILLVVLSANGASLNPLFVPMDIAIIFGMAVLWVISLQNHIFRNLEIRNVRRGSRKHLMTLNSMRRALVVAVICGVVALFLVLPQTTSYLEAQLTGNSTVVLAAGEVASVPFTNQDRLGLTRTTSLDLSASAGGVQAALGTATDYDDNGLIDEPLTNLSVGVVAAQIPVDPTGFRSLVLQLNNTGGSGVNVFLTRNVALAEGLLLFVPVFALLFVISSAAWITYLNPLRVQYAPSSIYSSDYEAALDSGDRTWRQIAKDRERRASAKRAPGATAKPVAKGEPPAPPPPPTVEMLAELPPPPEEDRDSLLGMGRELMQKRNYEAALKCYDGALKQDRDDPEALEGRAQALLKLRMEEDAESTLKRLLEVDEDSLFALLILAEFAESKGHYTRAVGYLERAVNLRPDEDDWWVHQGDVLLKLDREGDAYDAFRNALKVNPQNEEAKAKLSLVEVDVDAVLKEAMAKSSTGDYQGAVDLYGRILRQDPEHILALLGKGAAYRKLDKPVASAEVLQRVLGLDPSNQAALMGLASLSEDEGRWEQALDLYDALLEVNPGDEEAMIRRGDAQAELGLMDEALETYRRAAEEHPDSPEARERADDMVGRIEHERDAAMKWLVSLPGIGPAKARAIVEAGFSSMASLKRAKPGKLAKVKGISRKLAKSIANALKE